MDTMFETLVSYWAFPFVRYALVVGILVALCASLLGVPLVLKRMSVIGDGLSHVAFGSMALAAALNFTDNTPFVLLVTIIVAVLLLRGGRRRKIRGDAAIAMLAAGSLAIGYLLLNVFSPSANVSGDVCATLFGSTSLLTLSPRDVWLCAAVSFAVLSLFAFFYNKIFAVTFDPAFASATGVRADLYDDVIAVVVAAVIVLAMKLVGALLVSALLVFPALSAMRLFRSFRSVTLFAAVFSVVCATVGMGVSILCATPVGATIVALELIAFALCAAIGWILHRRN